jgi:tripartite-type tricarboxylate transporter receptor subunit TctC
MKHSIHRRKALVVGTGLLGTAAMSSLAQPQAYPSRPITIVVPFAPGGAVDNSARAIADRLGKVLGQNVNVESRAGAGGAIGSSPVARAVGGRRTAKLRCVRSRSRSVRLPTSARTSRCRLPKCSSRTCPLVSQWGG